MPVGTKVGFGPGDRWGPTKGAQPVVKVRGNGIHGPLTIAGERSQAPHSINGTSSLRGAPSAGSRALNFFGVPAWAPNL